jgi:hypothetical protein
MEKITIHNDIKVFYVTAKSFPDGIQEAFDKLYAIIPGSDARVYYGLSRPEKGVVTYRAAVEELYPGEAAKLNCQTLVIRKGIYVSSTIYDFMKNVPEIGQAFRELLSQPDLDPEGYCVEWYFNEKDVLCMLRLNDNDQN